MKIGTFLVLVFSLLFPVLSQGDQEEMDRKGEEQGIGGFLFDNTKTRIGKDFYQAFSMAFDFPPGTEHLNVTVEEQTDPRLGTRILIHLEDQIVYLAILKPRLEEVEERAEEAAQGVFNYLMDYLKYQKYLEEERFM